MGEPLSELEQHAYVAGFWTPPQVRQAILEHALRLREREARDDALGEADAEFDG